ncbi:lipoprotein, putative [Xanthomonas oryzae pv. oryzicola BLS256]|uniref:Lipoprotein, putative n=1 Tax=Xanthomonas oryzae pv. oryzicola (strain BLS256) TaxID=383407 RepID=G7TAX5_XANOB|nr:lipoprotein, putative [Xanthomonas oryzae pv. oryzicola BLS256]QEO96606.1 lipoprotein, putative [Xanthomonas oryzae pv. oryzicola]
MAQVGDRGLEGGTVETASGSGHVATSCGQKGCVLSQMRSTEAAQGSATIVAPGKPRQTAAAGGESGRGIADKEAARTWPHARNPIHVYCWWKTTRSAADSCRLCWKVSQPRLTVPTPFLLHSTAHANVATISG